MWNIGCALFFEPEKHNNDKSKCYTEVRPDGTLINFLMYINKLHHFFLSVAVFCDEWTAWNEVAVAEFQSILVLIGKETQLLKNFTFIFQAYLNAYHFMERQLNSLQLWQQRNDFRSSFFCCSDEKEERGCTYSLTNFFFLFFPFFPSFFFHLSSGYYWTYLFNGKYWNDS